MREEFEAWLSKQPQHTSLDYRDGSYIDWQTLCAWQGWKAAWEYRNKHTDGYWFDQNGNRRNSGGALAPIEPTQNSVSQVSRCYGCGTSGILHYDGCPTKTSGSN